VSDDVVESSKATPIAVIAAADGPTRRNRHPVEQTGRQEG